MKSLMFFAAGSILHGTGTRDMEKLGGLMKRMPWTGSAMMVGAVAIAALPPLNGFVSKWLLYLGLLQCGFAANNSGGLTALFAVGLLALIGGLAAVAFVRLTGIILLGAPRSNAAEHAHESSPWLVGPMVLLVMLCLGVGVMPQMVAGWLAAPLQQILGTEVGLKLFDMRSAEIPLDLVGIINAWTLIAGVAVAFVVAALSRQEVRTKGMTWGCGYVMPTVRMQYSGRSFAEMLSEHLLPRFLRPRTSRQAPQGLFPSKSGFGCECPDPVSKNLYEPFFHECAMRFSRLRILQQGKVHVYLIYIALMVVLALAWVSLRTRWSTS
jgi:NADH:ubiquinone oxidoreductase subunit 5 (subunit L)/multisubunit Na+/H+ antiporter MnhA subunit